MKGLALVLVLLPLAASAATITVDSAADSQFPFDGQCTLREAIDNVNAAADMTGGDCVAGTGSDDTIVFDLLLPATILLTMESELTIDTDVVINGPSTGLLAVDGNGQVGVLHITAGTVRIANLIIQNGRSAQGGGIYNNGTLTLTNCTLSGNAAGEGGGGGIYNDSGGTATLTDCTLGGNATAYDDDYPYDQFPGGGIYNNGILALANCALGGNMANGGGGGGIYNDSGGTATLTNCTLGGNAARADGAGIYNNGDLTAIHCTVFGNTTFENGGGVYNGGTVTLIDCTVNGNDGNDAVSGSGVYNDTDGSATLTHCMLFANGGYTGGAIYNDGTAIVTGCTFAANNAYRCGGGVDNEDHGTLTLADCTFVGNIAGDGGGAIRNAGEATLTNCMLSFNVAEFDNGSGGGAVANVGTMSLTDCTVFGNRATSGGGLHNDYYGTVTLANCSVNSNSADPYSGGGIASYSGTVILTSCTLSGNSAPDRGGGIDSAATLSLTDCTLSGNSSGDGGGISIDGGTAILSNCTLSENTAHAHANAESDGYGGFGGGGGILNGQDATLALTGCTLNGNSASLGGGGLYNDGTAFLTNSTLSGNSAGGESSSDDSPGGGGGVYNDYGTVTLTNCTLSGNAAAGAPGGNIYYSERHSYYGYETVTTLSNTIVANSLSGDNCGPDPVTDGGHNLDTDGTCGIGPAMDPRLDPAGLADNGGPTQTIALLPDSPAINAGDQATCAVPPVDNVDQRGVVRLAAGSTTCSIGAYEYQPFSALTPTTLPTTTPTPTAPGTSTIAVNSTADDPTGGDGQCTLREAIANVNAHTDTSSGDCAAGTGTDDTIVFGLFLPAKIILDATLEISSDVTINGPGEGLLALDGNGMVRVIDITAGTVTISNLTIENGSGLEGGGIRNTGTLTLRNCTLSRNSGRDGGGVYNDRTMTMVSCTLRNNLGGDGGGVYNDVDGTLLLSHSTLDNNSVGGGNYPSGDGGGVHNNGTMTVANCTLVANDGGGVANQGTLTMTDCIVSGNLRSGDGGGVSNAGTLTMTDCMLDGNTAEGNYGGGGGGAIHNDNDGEATLTNCILSFNSARYSFYGGGGVSNVGTMTLANCTLFGNSADYSAGGGLYNAGTVTLTNCTLNSNSVFDGGGGGVYNACDYDCGTAVLTNCTLTGNSAGGGYYGQGGGGVSNERGGTVTLTNCTLSGNSAQNGLGGNLAGPQRDDDCQADNGVTTLANTIIANSLGGGNCAGCGITDAGHNLDSDGTCNVGPVTDPRLDPAGPANNGGPTLTIALLPDSPAIDAGDESICAAAPVNDLDQRGQVRPGPGVANCSIGAYEYDLPVPTRTPTPTPTVTPTLGPTVRTCATVAEGGYLVLSCTDGIIVAIDFASYGTPQGSCGSFTQGSCHASNSLAVITNGCVGRTECEISAKDVSFDEDPCPGIPKTLAVQAECSVSTPTPTETGMVTPTPPSTPTPTITATPLATSLATASPTPTPPACTGDCDGDHHVDEAELLRMVDSALGNQAAAGCVAGAGSGMAIEVTEVIAAVGHALSGCP